MDAELAEIRALLAEIVETAAPYLRRLKVRPTGIIAKMARERK